MRRARVEPGGRAAAPGALALVQAFANSVDCLTGQDLLTSPALLRAWLAQRDLLGAADTEELRDADDLRRALAFRTALRALIRSNTDGRPDSATLYTLDTAAARVRLRIAFAPGGSARL